MSVKTLKKQLAALKIEHSAVEFMPITDDMTLAEAMQVYNENLRASRSYFPRPTGDVPTLAEATRIYNDQLKMTSHGAIK